MIVIVMGVSGSGKTTVGRLIAERLGWQFEDADDYHSAANKAKMRSGQPLNDEDREPWLVSLREMIEDRLERNASTVLACSALKSVYREKLVPAGVAEAGGGKVPSKMPAPSQNLSPKRLGQSQESLTENPSTQNSSKVVFLYLKASFEEITSRLAERKHEFMNPALLKSQFQTLEEPIASVPARKNSFTGSPIPVLEGHEPATERQGSRSAASSGHSSQHGQSVVVETIIVETDGLSAEQVTDEAVRLLNQC